MLDNDLFEEWLVNLSERCEAYDIIEMMDNVKVFTAWEVIEMCRARLLDIYTEENEEN